MTKGSVYFAQAEAGGPIKIGFSAEANKRLRDLSVGSPQPLVLLLVIQGDPTRERELHQQFAAGRLHGEWFRADTPGLVEFIANQNFQQAGLEAKQVERVTLLKQDDDYLRLAREVGILLRLSTATVLNWWEAGRLPGFRIHGIGRGPLRFRLGDIRELISTRRSTQAHGQVPA